MRRLTDKGRNPHFGASGDRIYYTEDAQPRRKASRRTSWSASMLNGKDRRVHATLALRERMEVSPNGDWLAFRENYQVYVVPMPPGGQVELSLKTKAVPHARASARSAATSSSWIDGDTLDVDARPGCCIAAEMDDVCSSTRRRARRPGTAQKHGERIADLSVTQPADKPSRHGRAHRRAHHHDERRGAGDRRRRDRDSRQPHRRRRRGGRRADSRRTRSGSILRGRTVMPGLIDIHAHGPQGVNDIVPQQNWSALAHLALGRDDRARSVEPGERDLSRPPSISAPAGSSRRASSRPARSSTARTLEGFASIDKIEDARNHVQRLKAQGAISVKNYNQPRREQRQMVVTAAREAGLMVVAEGGSLYHMDMNIIADGNTGLEHNLPPERFYDDVLQFWPATGVGYTPTLVVTFGGLRRRELVLSGLGRLDASDPVEVRAAARAAASLGAPPDGAEERLSAVPRFGGEREATHGARRAREHRRARPARRARLALGDVGLRRWAACRRCRRSRPRRSIRRATWASRATSARSRPASSPTC